MTKTFSELYPQDATFNLESRMAKAKKIVAVISSYRNNLRELACLDYGCSMGLMTNYFASKFKDVVGIDVDGKAIARAKAKYNKRNLDFKLQTNAGVPYPDNSFEVVVFNQVYEHMDNPKLAMEEIFRVLKTGGVCYFGARNKYFPLDGHYLLPFISYFPRRVSNFIFKSFLGRKNYDIKLYSLKGLKKLTKEFKTIDYTLEVFQNPGKFYLSKNLRFLSPLAKLFYFLIPNYIWLLVKV